MNRNIVLALVALLRCTKFQKSSISWTAMLLLCKMAVLSQLIHDLSSKTLGQLV